MDIQRTRTLHKLIRKKHNGLIKVITGLRRVGKSYLLNTLFYDHLRASGVDENHIIKIALDTSEGENISTPKDLISAIQSKITDTAMHYILIDEIQMLDRFETALNTLLYERNLDIYVTGSNSKFLSSDILTEFRGRGDEIHVYPLSFAEFMSVYPGDKYEGFTDYLTYGGLPLSVLQEDAEDREAYLKTLFKETYLKDIITRNKIRNTPALETLTDILASQTGSLTNPKRIADTFASVEHTTISPVTIQTYIHALEDAFLISCAKRYNIRGRQYIGSPQKYYFEDIGLRNARLSFRQYEETYLMENALYNELRMRGFNVDVGVVEKSAKDKNGKSVRKSLEVDFVANKGNKRYYIQSALSLRESGKMEQEKNSLANIDDSFKKIIVTADIVRPHRDETGILVMSVYDFLLREESMDE
ncbi:MAG TPA: ATP-binding protein [Methanocorpusculum sp.]|nr:ATP-binding protein [Methanocorpusculum sp.]